MHSSRYTNAQDLDLHNKHVLVVGCGNSGMEISLDLVEHQSKATLLQRTSQVLVPRWGMGAVQDFFNAHLYDVPWQPLGFVPMVFFFLGAEVWFKYAQFKQWGWNMQALSKAGFLASSNPILVQFFLNDTPAVQDIGTVEAVQRGLMDVVNAEVDEMLEDGTVKFKDGSSKKFDAVVYCTGYQKYQAQHRLFKVGG